jgi:restriction system protein
MASGYRRDNRRKYTKHGSDHAAFVLVILLAAAVYVHKTNSIVSKQTSIVMLCMAAVLFSIILLVIARRRLLLYNCELRLSRSHVDTMSGVEFERYVAHLLPSQGYRYVELTEYFDYGIDIMAEKDGVIWGIQVKRYSSPVGVDAVREVVTALSHYECDRAMVITSSSFSLSAQKLAASNNCVLVDGHQLMRWAYH